MTRKQITLTSALFLLVFLIGTVINTPVTQLFHLIHLPKQVAIQGLQGSITKGKVDVVEIQGYTIFGLHFHLQPACLLKFAVCYQLSSDESGLLLNLDRSLITQSTNVSDSYIDLPSTTFDNIPGLLVKPAGDFRIEIRQLELNSEQRLADLSALVQWNNAGIQGENQVIGNYAADISTTKDGFSALLSDKNSLLGLKGDVTLSWKGSYVADLEFEHKAGLNPSLLSVLEMSAKKTRLNQFKMNRKGVLPPNILNQLQRFSPG
jgi:hypothetical protein